MATESLGNRAALSKSLGVSPFDHEEKTCPFCAESIKAAAIVCKHCHADLAGTHAPPDSLSPAKPSRATSSADAGIESCEVAGLLASLADKSLVVLDSESGRYRLLETVRQYARDRLLEGGDGAAWRDRHLSHFMALAEEAESHDAGGEQQAWLGRLETDDDNLRAALEWSAEEPASAESCLRLTGALTWFWMVRGPLC